MKIYELQQATGEPVAVSSLAQAREVLAEFELQADRFLAEVESTTSVEDEPFDFWQRVEARWNANLQIWETMEADEDLQFADRKATHIKSAQAIRDMARNCQEI